MTKDRCPLCGGKNKCIMESDKVNGACWCVTEEFPEQVFENLSKESLWEECICPRCLTLFKENLSVN